MEKIKFNDFFQEYIYVNTLSSGMRCYIIPKKNYVEKQVAITVKYGSADSRFEIGGQKLQYPDGIAHFLEHKLFEDERVNVFDAFSKQDADVNAFTNYTNTAYYFNCVRGFEDNLKLLLEVVQKPYFTDENVEKEKGIIIQEINMYRDDPFWRGYLSLQEAMYFENPIRRDIAGTEESVGKITKDMLYECYNSFYTPDNMAIVCVGDFDVDVVCKIAEKEIQSKNPAGITRLYGSEPGGVRKRHVETNMPVAVPMFHIGFKDKNHGECNEICDKTAVMKILTDYIAGDSSPLYERMYGEGLIDSSFSLDYSCGEFFGHTIFSGLSDNSEGVNDAILQEIRSLRENGLDEGVFEQLRRKHMGKLLKTFNNIQSITTAQVDFFAKDKDLFDLAHSYRTIEMSVAEQFLEGQFLEEDNALSVVKNS